MPSIQDVKNRVEKVMSGEKKKDSCPKDAIEWIKQHLDDLKQSSSAKQATVGALTGYTSGFVFGKFGRAAATAVGGTVLAIHFAQHYGYITINWNRVNHDVEKARKELQKKAEKDLPKLVDQLQRFLVENVLLAGGFAGGFFLGLASS